MAYENFDVSALPNYVEQRYEPLVHDVVFGGKLINRVRIQTGVKGSAAINVISLDPAFQTGSCGFTSEGSVTLSQRVIDTANLKVNLEICPENLINTYAEYLTRVVAEDRADLPFEEYIIRGLIANVNNTLEKLLFQGDTSSDDATLVLYDGLIKTANAAVPEANKVAIASGVSAYDGVLDMYGKFTEEMLEKGAEIYVAPAIFRAFQQNLVAANLYHYNVEPVKELFIPGTNVKVVSMTGLTGSLVAIATYPDNLVYGTDIESAHEQIKVHYSNDDDVFKVRIKWNSGIQIAFPEDVVVGTFAAAPTI